ncbi:predicted protein [Chaetoceros tenuissimus]|uniref:Uncharacterized protein n=1 Tax=Chaetoceros tenuissimus TaxID=426638 RepID=A0AAD3GYD8_9STRA|nr:predicted protein [Chaetoceros tenuissimus]
MDIATFQSNLDFIKSLYFREKWTDEKCRDTILEAIEEANKKILEAFGESMHRLNEYKPTVDAVEEVVKKFPSTLSYEDHEDSMGRLPIHTADFYCSDDAPEYVPVLAKEGMKHKVGGEDARGGLLISDPMDSDDEWNTLQILLTAAEGVASIELYCSCFVR